MEQLYDFLGKLEVAYEEIEHESVYTSYLMLQRI